MSLTFLQLQNAVKGTRFDESQRTDIKNWINHQYGIIWNLESWEFLIATAPVTVTAGSSSVTSLPTTLGAVLALNRADGLPLSGLSARDYADLYYGQTATGRPVDFTKIGSSILVGPISNETSAAYQLTYEKSYSPLVNDSDVPVLPDEYHMTLVKAASATGLQLENDPTWQPLAEQVSQDIDTMRAAYLDDNKALYEQWGAWSPGAALTFYGG